MDSHKLQYLSIFDEDQVNDIIIYNLLYYKTAKNALPVVGEIRIDATANGQNLNRPLMTNRPYISVNFLHVVVCEKI